MFYSASLFSRDGGDVHVDIELDVDSGEEERHSTVVKFLTALWYLILSQSEVMCYLMVCINQMKSASVLSLPLPLLTFLWGTLISPRPTRRFWVTIIAYTMVRHLENKFFVHLVSSGLLSIF